MSLSNFKVSTRLAAGFGIVILLLVGIMALGINRLSVVNEATEVISKQRYPVIRLAFMVNSDISAIAISMRNTVLTENEDVVKREVESIKAASARITANLDTIGKGLSTEKGKALFKTIVDARAPYQAHQKEFIAMVTEGRSAMATNLLMMTMQKEQAAYMASVQSLVTLGDKLVDQASQDSVAVYESGRMVMMALAAAAIVFAAVFAWMLSRSITRPLQRAVEIARTVASGDLSQKSGATSRDETGQLMLALQEMTASLVGIVSNVRRGTDTIAAVVARDRGRQHGPVLAHRTAGQLAGRNRVVDGRTDRDRQAERRQCAPGQPAGADRLRRGQRGRRRWSTRWSTPWARSTRRRARSSTSSASSTASPSRPISWR